MLDNDLFPETRVVSPANELDECYTLREDVLWCLKKLGEDAYDLDVAACEESHHADEWFDLQTNGLKTRWHGNVWCNPPYSDIEPWVRKALKTCGPKPEALSVSMLLPASRTEQPWWQKHIEPLRDRDERISTHFLPGRTRFGMPGNPKGIGVGSPPFACVLVIFRRHRLFSEG